MCNTILWYIPRHEIDLVEALLRMDFLQLKLATIDDCRREMARVYRDARTGVADTANASRLVYMLTSIAKMIEIGQLEQRLTILEEHSNGRT